MKKALAGPAKRTAKKKPERRAMIAAARRRVLIVRVRVRTLTRRVDRAANRAMVKGWPRLVRAAGRAKRTGTRWARRLDRRLRPLGVRLFRLLSFLEKRLLRGRDLAIRGVARASAVLTPERAICLTIVAAAACLLASQFVEFHAVELGQPGYEGLPAATPPTIDAETAGQAHAYLLVPVAVLAAALALAVLRNGRRRGLGRIVFLLGLLSLAVVLLVDLPAGLDASAQEASFAGATAVLYDGFYAQIAAAVGLMLGGLLLSRARKPRLARTQGGRRSARTLFVRKQGGRPRTKPDDGLQRPAATMRARAEHEPTH
jgi:hypothetical protein